MKMKKGLLTMLALLSMGSMLAQDFSGPDARVVTARKGVLKVQLSSTTSYRDLQFDLTLPQGITLVTESVSPETPDKTNVKEGATGHVIAYNPVGTEGNVVRFAVYDQTNGNAFTDGVLIEIPVQATDAFTANDVANVTNVVTSDVDAKSYGKDDFNINILVNLLGDVNEDNNVNVTDVLTTAEFVLVNEDITKVPDMKNLGAADVDGGNVINVTDVVGIAGIAMEFTGNTPALGAKPALKDANIAVEDTLDPQ